MSFDRNPLLLPPRLAAFTRPSTSRTCCPSPEVQRLGRQEPHVLDMVVLSVVALAVTAMMGSALHVGLRY